MALQESFICKAPSYLGVAIGVVMLNVGVQQPQVAGRTAKDAGMLFGFSGLLGKFRF